MSHSPERISSYRRHFEDSSSSSYQVRVSSPSPTRRDTRNASAGYSCRGASSMRVESVGRRNVSAARRSRMIGAGVGAGAMVCVGPTGEPAMDLDAAAAENQEFLSTRTTERQEMIVLNDRLAVYIDKVRSLEQQNTLLETEIEAYQNRFEKPTGLRLLYEEQLRELKKIADQLRVQRDISLATKESTAAQLEAIKIKFEEAVELRKKAELDIETFRPDVDKATSSRIVLEKKLEQLEVEIEFLRRVHQQEIDELMKQIYAAHASAQSAFALPDLGAALKQIQNQYDDIAAKNLEEMDSWYKNKFEDLTSKASKHVDRVRGFREELAGAKKDIQSKERDLDALRTRNEALEAQIREMQEKYRKEQEVLQARIETLQLELKTIKEKIALHLREYQDLLNIKMSLEIEITTYRKLIEGEDLRLSGMVKTLSLTTCSMSAIGAGMSFSGGGMGGAGGVSGGMIGGSSGGVGSIGGGVGLGGGIGAGGMGIRSGSSAGGMGGRMGTGGPDDKRGPLSRAGGTGGADVGVGHGLGAGGVGAGGLGIGAGGMGAGGLGSGAGGMGAGGLGIGAGGAGAGGLGSGAGGMGAGGLGTGAGGVGAGGLGTGPGGFGAGGLGTGAGGVGAGGLGTGPGGVGAGGLDTGAGGLGIGAGGVGTGGLGTGAGGVGTGAGGVGAGGLGTGAGSVGVGGLGTGPGGIGAGAGVGSQRGVGSGAGGVVAGVGGKGGTAMGGAGGDTAGSVGTGSTGVGFNGGKGGIGGGMGDVTGGGIDRDASKDPGMGGRIGGITEGVGGGDEGVALSGVGGTGKIGGGMGDTRGSGMGYGSNGFDGNNEAYAEQAVELTERRTVLIRTVKNEDDVLEMDHQEQTYTITGAASDSDED